MAQPTLDWSGWGLTADHDPTSNEPWDNGIIQYGTWWINSNTNSVFWCSDQGNNDNTDLEWISLGELVSSSVTKTLHTVPSPAFDSPRTPSSSRDVMVNALVSISLTILQTSLITAQVDTGSGYVTVGQWGLGALALSGATNTLSFLVPAGATYRLMTSGTGTTSVSSIIETY